MKKETGKTVITPELLTGLRAKAQKATPGPWQLHEGSDTLVTGFEHRLICSNRHCCFNRPSLLDTASAADNAAYIAAANPRAILALLAELERLQREADWLAEAASQLCGYVQECEECSLFPDCVSKKSGRERWRKAAREAVMQANSSQKE